MKDTLGDDIFRECWKQGCLDQCCSSSDCNGPGPMVDCSRGACVKPVKISVKFFWVDDGEQGSCSNKSSFFLKSNLHLPRIPHRVEFDSNGGWGDWSTCVSLPTNYGFSFQAAFHDIPKSENPVKFQFYISSPGAGQCDEGQFGVWACPSRQVDEHCDTPMAIGNNDHCFNAKGRCPFPYDIPGCKTAWVYEFNTDASQHAGDNYRNYNNDNRGTVITTKRASGIVLKTKNGDDRDSIAVHNTKHDDHPAHNDKRAHYNRIRNIGHDNKWNRSKKEI